MRGQVEALMSIYEWPSQTLWRYYELQAYRGLRFDRPILEIGCGDGRFTRLILDRVDEAIDVNPRAVEKCRRLSGSLYGSVRCMDARDLDGSGGGFGTVYANCVMEHIPDLGGVLAGCHRGLRPGGRIVMTVPLLEMENHLLFRSRRYAMLRRRQLSHVNLLSREGWEGLLRAAGFTVEEFRPYLSGGDCRYWDAMDAPGCLGKGRYTLSGACRLVMDRVLPASWKGRILSRAVDHLVRRIEGGAAPGEPCAALFIAVKG